MVGPRRYCAWYPINTATLIVNMTKNKRRIIEWHKIIHVATLFCQQNNFLYWGSGNLTINCQLPEEIERCKTVEKWKTAAFKNGLWIKVEK